MSIPTLKLPPLSLGKVQIGVKMELKKWFFDTERVRRLLDKRTFGVLSHFGGFVRRWAINSIQRKPYGAIAPPGHPPFDHYGYASHLANKRVEAKKQKVKYSTGSFKGLRSILYGLDRARRSVVIGPVASNSQSDVLPALEYGGTSRVFTGSARRRRVVKTVTIRPHPFMQPAFEEGKRQLSRFWAQAKD